MTEYDDQEFEGKSKTQLKNEMQDLQQLGLKLVGLGPAALAKVPLDQELSDAINLAKRIDKKKEGYRRQLQFIGKLMRTRDVEPIQQALDLLENKHQQATAQFHKLERLRDDIVANGDSAINQAMELYPTLERQKLRQLSRQAQKEAQQNKPPKSSREIFQYLRQISEQ
ncbi:ribosome biogenesis factor YjgA [Bowmanella yangjiangensis]|uniref:Dual-action ribosomal maturation protein DarP n=1 Tax=Bowmanella yangjiangensis TaxID=2811230 RepID=A0ABS3CQE2_9ALTE|nr:ribosome biogenesis factor YjgA [Bowmanella yangjiangensis]MBN7819306.1 ribosome-associated protein [Bowmanella yangjiangensis]